MMDFFRSILNGVRLHSSIPSAPILPQLRLEGDPVKINDSCYRFYSPKYRKKNESLYQNTKDFLQSLPFPLQEKYGISATYCKIGSTSDEAQAEEGILWICNNKKQKKFIEHALERKNDYLEGVSHYKVAIRMSQSSLGQLTVTYCSEMGDVPTESDQDGMYTVRGQLSSKSGLVLGTLGVINSTIDWRKLSAASTLGGVVRIGASAFILTTAHAFKMPPEDDIIQGQLASQLNFSPVGRIAASEFKDSTWVMMGMTQKVAWDWALIKISPQIYLENRFKDPDSSLSEISIEGHIEERTLGHGEVIVCASSRSQRGFVSSNIVSMVMGDMVFEFRELYLTHKLEYGDSGAWVLLGKKVCGYIVAMASNDLLAYMVPISPVLRELSIVLSGLIQFGTPIEIPSSATVSRLLLYDAIKNNDIAFVELLLLQTDVDVNYPPRSGWQDKKTPLELALACGNVEIIQMLISNRGRGNDALKDPSIAPGLLERAAKRGDTSIVRNLLDFTLTDDTERNNSRCNMALQTASKSRNIEMIKLLLDSGADVNAEPGNGDSTVLENAAKVGDTKIVKLLLDRGARLHRNPKDATLIANMALHNAFLSENFDILKLLLDRGENITEILPTLANKQYFMLTKMLLGKTAENEPLQIQNWKAQNIQNLLRLAAKNDNIPLAEFILDNGADVDGFSEWEDGDNFSPLSQTALESAATSGNIYLSEILLKRGANPELTNLFKSRQSLLLAAI